MANILVTGATGYIGGRLIPRLLAQGETLRCLVREQVHAVNKPWRDKVDLVTGDVLEPDSLTKALQGIHTAYYLIHSMSHSSGFADKDRRAALNFAAAAKHAGVKHIIYLGGLGDPDKNMSSHLRSRQETGACLASSEVPVTEFRAAIIVGSGSISFEMIRYLTERLPVMITPKWVDTKVQPIAIRDVLEYLLLARTAPHIPETGAHITVEIGGPEVLTYRELMLTYAEIRGLKRRLVPVPVLSPRLSSYWVNLVTPIPGSIATPLVEGLTSEVIVDHPEAASSYPVTPISYRQAVELALDRSRQGATETLWSQSFYEPKVEKPERLSDTEGMLRDRRCSTFAVRPDSVFQAITRIGGEEGWYSFDWLWQLRGVIDRLVGGIGMRRGRRDPKNLVAGDVLDFWRVQAIKPNKYLQLHAEMKLPGQGWLRYDLSEQPNGHTQVEQVAYFEPKGLLGYLYWWAVYPLHLVIFPTMLEKIGEHATAIEAADQAATTAE